MGSSPTGHTEEQNWVAGVLADCRCFNPSGWFLSPEAPLHKPPHSHLSATALLESAAWWGHAFGWQGPYWRGQCLYRTQWFCMHPQDSTLWLDCFPVPHYVDTPTDIYIIQYLCSSPLLSLPHCQGKPMRLHSISPIIVPSPNHYVCGCYLCLLCCVLKCCLCTDSPRESQGPHKCPLTTRCGPFYIL